jgi:hypothetical protein
MPLGEIRVYSFLVRHSRRHVVAVYKSAWFTDHIAIRFDHRSQRFGVDQITVQDADYSAVKLVTLLWR